jgi:two-component system nitrogen regulation sensor histidine kinase GlnL
METLHLDCTVTPVECVDARLLLEFRPMDAQLKVAREEQLAHQQQANRELIRNLAHEIKNPSAASAARPSCSSGSWTTRSCANTPR